MKRTLALALLLAGCATTRPYVAEPYEAWREVPLPEGEVAHRVFLVGDTGDPQPDGAPLFEVLARQFGAAGEDALLVFLGDNIYERGLLDPEDPGYAVARERLQLQLEAVADAPGRVLFIPGNHDWDDGGPAGWDYIVNQQRAVEAFFGYDEAFEPDGGHPGPVEIDVNEWLTLLVIDTQWWLHRFEKPYGDSGGYDLDSVSDFVEAVDDAVKRNRKKALLVVGHHPMASLGTHSGRAPLRDHLFPLRKLHRRLWVPLPGLGSVPYLLIRYRGGRQDLSHPDARALRRALMGSFTQHPGLIYAGAHDHTLQYIPSLQQHYLVSGAGARPSFVGRGAPAAFTAEGYGFLTLTYYADGRVWLEAWGVPDAAGAEAEILFRTELNGPDRDLVDPELPDPETLDLPDYRDSTVVRAVGPQYAAGPVKGFFMGRHHRDAWATPVEVPVLDLGPEGTAPGGLTPVKRGGGMQTISLRLEDARGKEYVLRSIDKDPSKTVPEALQGTVATEVVQDQVTVIHPYGAFMIPPLAEAAGIYHTHPRLVFVPDDPRLGIYRDVFAGRVMMLERRPDDDETANARFGRSEDVMSPASLYEEVDGDNDHRVDQRTFARARLLDMLLADWDRHRDQWRWAAFEPHELDSMLTGEARTQGKVYRPVPRDRDWAFNHMDGLLPPLVRFVLPKFQDFTERYGYLPGLTLNGLEQDRRFTNALTRLDWQAEAEHVRAALTDSVIDAAVRRLPPEVYALHGPDVARILKARRDQLPGVAGEVYELLAGVVDVVGSNKHERFEVHRVDGTWTEVVVTKTTKEGEPRGPFYRRRFRHDETREVRLFGLGGDDQFVVTGRADRGLRVIAVGGPGADRFADSSRVTGPRAKTRFYDTATGNAWAPGPETKVVREERPGVNRYNSLAYRHDVRSPLLFFGANDDDGAFVGGGLRLTRFGFRREPYARMQALKANVATRTGAFNVIYEGHFVRALGGLDAAVDASWLSPGAIRNFYGLGNETEDAARDRTFYEARLTQVRLAPAVRYGLSPSAFVRLGPTFEYTRVEPDEGRFITAPQAGVSARTFDDPVFVGFAAALALASVDDPVRPTLGYRLEGGADAHAAVRAGGDSFVRMHGAWAGYLPVGLDPQLVLALRAGGAHLVGDFPFYSATTLGGRDNLRGYRSTRFAGRSSAYGSAELRLRLRRFTTFYAIGEAGIFGFLDAGRVWADGERSGVWHRGVGGGAWVNLFGQFALTATLARSPERTVGAAGFGFFY